MVAVTIYHNPRCSKSRQTLELLREKGIEPEIIEYLNTPPDAEGLRMLLAKLGIGPRELIRKNEAIYKELGLDDPLFTDNDLIAAMVQHPRLIERPIVVKGNKAVIGRPPERALDIL